MTMPVILHPPGFRASLVAMAAGQVGKREVGKNGGQAVRAYQSATDLPPGSWPWCAAFVCWAYMAASVPFPSLSAIRPRTALAVGFEAWGTRWGAKITSPSSVRPGDIAIFQFKTGNHCGIIASNAVSGRFDCIEGNTDGTGGRDGDGVYRRRRSLSSLRSIVRIYESDTPQTA